jgi:hypothetical protein
MLGMASPHPPEKALDPRILIAALLALALLAMGPVLVNDWVQDDTGIILRNPLIKSLSGVWEAFGRPYWPEKAQERELYRPLQIALFTIQWAVADGAPWLFRVVNLIAYGLSVAAVFALLRRVAPLRAAWVGAAIFAVHPVHVEAVAVSVNQGESFVAAILAYCCAIYLDWRRGLLPWRGTLARILPLFTAALFIKEHALVLPGLFFALELTVLRTERPLREVLRPAATLVVALFTLGGVFWTIRGSILGGGSGTNPAEALQGLTATGRALTMLSVVPEWVRLLLWPAHLQMEWSPQEHVPWITWSLRDTIGVTTLLSLGLALALSWGRRPRIALALLWAGAALFPVSNLLLPTGVVIAERVLFLASVAVALLAADLAVAVAAIPAVRVPPLRPLLTAGVALLLGTGLVASATRMRTWKNRVLFMASAVVDAPLSYRTHLSWGIVLIESGDRELGEAEFRRAFSLHYNNYRPFFAVAHDIRKEQGDCEPAAVLYDLLREKFDRRGDLFAGSIACSTWIGAYDKAAADARTAIALGVDPEYWRRAVLVIDSAAARAAPPRTVRLPALPGGWIDVGPPAAAP